VCLADLKKPGVADQYSEYEDEILRVVSSVTAAIIVPKAGQREKWTQRSWKWCITDGYKTPKKYQSC